MMKKVALFGNPNTGKSSLFNRLTGLNQRVANFPGVTVDKQLGLLKLEDQTIELIDFPGTYSVYPRSADEKIVYDVINNPAHKDYPELAIVVVDASNLERNLLLFTQLSDLDLPTILVLNMTDVAARKQITINVEELQLAFPNVAIIRCNARVGMGIPELKKQISIFLSTQPTSKTLKKNGLIPLENRSQQEIDTNERFVKIKQILQKAVVNIPQKPMTRSTQIDRWLTHPFWGYFIFTLLLLLIFQSVFTFASYPMEWIETGFASLSSKLNTSLPAGLLTDLLTEGIIPGIGGVVIFIPQIGLLFFLLSILEETGYMSRVVFIMDKLMRPFGLNGKSVVPLISSSACAIPGIMATRTIPSWHERLTTILIAPLMSCSARIPVYTLLIALVIPKILLFGAISLQGLVLFGLYALGLISALVVARIIQFFFKHKETSLFLLEMPSYKTPRWNNVGIEVIKKVRVFVTDAGKIIVAISIVLWALATFGPGNDMAEAAQRIPQPKTASAIDQDSYERTIAAVKLEHSYIGIMGKGIEPMIRPLGYDWKMGISLITSFAAREVFVGSLATIYAVHQEEAEPKTLTDRLRLEKKADGKPTYSLASGASLLIFYVFAMQCMATFAVVKRETKSWKWPLIQLGYMGFLAYLGAFLTYQILS